MFFPNNFEIFFLLFIANVITVILSYQHWRVGFILTRGKKRTSLLFYICFVKKFCISFKVADFSFQCASFLRIQVKYSGFILLLKKKNFDIIFKISHNKQITDKIFRWFFFKFRFWKIFLWNNFSVVRRVSVAIVILWRNDKIKFCRSMWYEII